MFLLVNIINVHAMKKEKALTTKLQANYDIQLAQKKKEIESRKLLESVAKNQKKINIRNDQQKNIKNNNSVTTQQKKNKQIKKELRQLPFDLSCTIGFAFLTSVCIYPALCVMMSMRDGVPVGYYESWKTGTCIFCI
jgi:L-arabinose isomerase